MGKLNGKVAVIAWPASGTGAATRAVRQITPRSHPHHTMVTHIALSGGKDCNRLGRWSQVTTI
ncbi:MAG: hypothetical protein V3S51_05680 [Dehalococcoidia bacterium]